MPNTLSRLSALTLLILAAACGGGGDAGQTVTVYSPHGREMLTAFKAQFEAANPGVTVEAVDMGSQEVFDRIRSERANPQADVWWGAPANLFETAAQDSLLERFVPTWAGALPADAKSPQGLWHGNYLTPEVIAYNSAAIPAVQAPQDWDDVLDPRWKGQVLIRDPMASGTMRTIFGMVIDRSLRATNDTAQGFTWLRRLDGQTREYVLNPTMLYQKLARQEGLVTLWDMPDIELIKKQYNYPIDYVIPRSGTPLLVDGVAVVRGGPNAELARRFVEFIGSNAALAPAARDFFRLPARSDFPADSLPERLRAIQGRIKPEPIDWNRLQQQGPAWMRYWDEHV
ncbi:MAG TPA: extracellular solute-binding protein, partial [Longimicrobium sp.]|nr:extracellular solute-binding protein [Longimicrobium sp.]